MAVHPDFPKSPHDILDPDKRWFPADEALRETTMDKLLPPLVPELRKQVKAWRDRSYAGATDTSCSLLNCGSTRRICWNNPMARWPRSSITSRNGKPWKRLSTCTTWRG